MDTEAPCLLEIGSTTTCRRGLDFCRVAPACNVKMILWIGATDNSCEGRGMRPCCEYVP